MKHETEAEQEQEQEEWTPRGWTVRVDLTPEQEAVALRNAGAQRKAHNWAVAVIKAEYRGGDKRIWSAWSLRARWYEERDEVAPWWAENSKEAYSSGIASAVAALKNFQDYRKGKRAGERVGFPRFKKKQDTQPVFTVSTGMALLDSRHLRIPVVGVVRSQESLRRMHRAQGRGDLRITGMVLRRRSNGKWYLSIKHRTRPGAGGAGRLSPQDPGSVVGVDLGVAGMLSTASDGTVVRRTPSLHKAQEAVRAAQRRTKRRTKDSARHREAKRCAARASRRVADVRKDLIHKETTRLAKTHGTVVVENLAVKAMARGWSQKAGASGMREFRRQVEYKAARTLVASRWYPSSKTCSACDTVNAWVELKHTVWTCEACGARHQRDVNASHNLAQLGAAWIGGKTVPCAPHDEMKRKPRLKKAA